MSSCSPDIPPSSFPCTRSMNWKVSATTVEFAEPACNSVARTVAKAWPALSTFRSMFVSFSCTGAARSGGTSTVKATCQMLCNLRRTSAKGRNLRLRGSDTVHPTYCSSTSSDSATVATHAPLTSATVTPSAVNSKSPARTCQLRVVLVLDRVVSPSGVAEEDGSEDELLGVLDVLELLELVDDANDPVVLDEDVFDEEFVDGKVVTVEALVDDVVV
mmetsp:Transcript_57518/g.129077  ORF Transcript_57518/g.129077 Transcript_57518/m.129077 type:complete len:217 (+) Transcript_57518:2349-2999(+)